MKLSITGRHLVVTPAIREFTEERLERVGTSVDGISEAHVVLVKEKHRHIAEVVVKGKKLLLSSTQATDDMYTSIGRSLDKIEQQARKHREKMIEARRRRGSRRTSGGNGAEAHEVLEEEVVANLSENQLMIRDEEFPRKPMSAEEAALNLSTGDGPFLVFRDAATQRVGVVYHRPDGHVGLILPEE